MKKFQVGYFLKYILLFCFSFLFTYVKFKNVNYTVLMGDDIIYLYDFVSNNSPLMILKNFGYVMAKYRPIYYLFMYLPVKFFGLHYQNYFLFNIVLFSVLSLVLYYVVYKISNKVLYGILAVSLMIMTPFNAYSIMQVYGSMEILSLLIISLIFLLCYQYYIGNATNKKCFLIFLLFFCSIFIAERNMCLALAIIFTILISQVKLLKKLFHCFIICIPLILKHVTTIISNSNMLQTGRGTVFELLNNVIAFSLKGFINIMGYSIGDEWHGGFKIYQISGIILLISTFIFIFVFSFITRYVSKNYKDLKTTLIFFVFFLVNLLPYSLIALTHGEDRFLLTPYFILIIFLFYIARNFSLKNKNILVCICMLVAFKFIVDVYYNFNKDMIHFKYSQEIAQSVYEDVKKNINTNENVDVVFLNCGDEYKWIFADKLFMKYYFGQNCDTHYFKTIDEIPNNILEDINTLFIVPDNNFDVPFKAKVISKKEMIM